VFHILSCDDKTEKSMEPSAFQADASIGAAVRVPG
jgi:hypothetical protein